MSAYREHYLTRTDDIMLGVPNIAYRYKQNVVLKKANKQEEVPEYLPTPSLEGVFLLSHTKVKEKYKISTNK